MILELLERPYWVFQQYDLKLDLGEDSEFRLTQLTQNLTGSSLNLTSTLPIPIPASPKNMMLLGEDSRTYIPCRCIVYGVVIPITGLFWSNYDATSISIELVHAQRDWAKALSTKKLTSIELRENGSLTMDAVSLSANWDAPIWQDNTPPFYLGLARYNCLLTQSYTDVENNIDYSKDSTSNCNVSFSDFRPYVSALYLMRKMFEAVGWNFRSPLFESEYGRSLYCYLLAEKFAQDNGIRSRFRATYTGATYNAHNPALTTLFFPDVTATGNYNGGDYNDSTSTYTSPYLYPVKVKVSTGLFLSHSFATKKIVKVTIRFWDDTMNDVFDYKELDFVVEAGETLECIVEWDRAIMLPLQHIQVRARIVDGVVLNCHANSWLQLSMADNAYYAGDLLNPLLRDDMCLDVLKGIAHTINGYFITNLSTKEVWLYPPKDVDIFGEGFEGFYCIYTRPVTGYGFKISRTKLANRDMRIGWKGTQDTLYTETLPDYGKKVIRLNDNELEDTENLNPYFDAVFEGLILKERKDSYLPTTITIDTDTSLTVLDKVNPFMVRAFGLVRQLIRYPDRYTVNPFAVPSKVFKLVGTQTMEYVQTHIPYISQIPTAYKEDGMPFMGGFSYGEFGNDLSQSFYEPFLQGAIDIEFITPDIQLSEVVSEEVFRTKMAVHLNGNPIIVYPTRVSDFQTNTPSVIGGVFNVKHNPSPCDGWQVTSQYKAFDNVNGFLLNNRNYITSILVDGVELLNVPILVGYYPPTTMNDFFTNVANALNFYYLCTYSGGELTLTLPRCSWVEITIGAVDTINDLSWKWFKIDPIGSWIFPDGTSLGFPPVGDVYNWTLLRNNINKTYTRWHG